MTGSHYLDLAREKLIVALDYWNIKDARKFVRTLATKVFF